MLRFVFVVFDKDIEPPTITCPSNQTKRADLGQPSTSVSWSDVTAEDNAEGDLQISTSSNTQPGSRFTIGKHSVIYHVEDAAGNTASCFFMVTITGLYCDIMYKNACNVLGDVSVTVSFFVSIF